MNKLRDRCPTALHTLPPHLTILYPLTFLSSTSALITLADVLAVVEDRSYGYPPSYRNFFSVCNISLSWNYLGYLFDQHLSENQVHPVDGPRQHKWLCAAFHPLTTHPVPPSVLFSWMWKTKEIVGWKRKLPAASLYSPPRAWKPLLTPPSDVV